AACREAKTGRLIPGRGIIGTAQGQVVYIRGRLYNGASPTPICRFDRKLEKVVSLSAGIASAAFTQACGVPVHFDSRVWLGADAALVVDYFRWRQADAARCALHGWCYWTL